MCFLKQHILITLLSDLLAVTSPPSAYMSAYDTTIPVMLRDRSIGSWHIGHAIDAAANPSSHPTHTAADTRSLRPWTWSSTPTTWTST